MREGDRVKMVSFKGRKWAPTPMNPESLRELLLGCTGTEVANREEVSPQTGAIEEKRVLVRFDADLYELGLNDETDIPNTLWIPEYDLQLL